MLTISAQTGYINILDDLKMVVHVVLKAFDDKALFWLYGFQKANEQIAYNLI